MLTDTERYELEKYVISLLLWNYLNLNIVGSKVEFKNTSFKIIHETMKAIYDSTTQVLTQAEFTMALINNLDMSNKLEEVGGLAEIVEKQAGLPDENTKKKLTLAIKKLRDY